MQYEKKYWSENEYKFTDGTAYVGYVGIYDRKGYVYDTEEELIKNDSYSAQINSSEYFYDRILDEEIVLPYDKRQVQFAANDFLNSGTLKDILLKLQANNDYIFRNTIISNTLLPACERCDILATKYKQHYVFVGSSGLQYDQCTAENIEDIKAGFIINTLPGAINNLDSYELEIGEYPKAQYDSCYKVPKVTAYYDLDNGVISQHNLAVESSTKTALDPTFYPQYNENGEVINAPYNFNEIEQADMKIIKIEETETGRKLHLLVFLVFKTKVVIFRYIYFQDDNSVVQAEATDSRYENEDDGKVDFNDPNDILVLDKVDPGNKNSLQFLGLKDIVLYGNNMYLIDEKLNMALRYDITYLLHDESELRWQLKSIRLLNSLQGEGKLTDNLYFNGPVSIAVDDNWAYIADRGNSCIKKYTSSFDFETTIRFNSDIQSISINPYAITLEDGLRLEAGTLWAFSVKNNSLYVTIINSKNKIVYNKKIEKIELLKDQYTWDEEFKSVKFSFTNSNYYYLSTTKRVYKFHLSRPLYPFASLSYFKQRSLISTMAWQSVPYAWHLLPDGTIDENSCITWSHRPGKSGAEILDNRAFCVCGIDSSELIDDDSTKQQQFNGDLILHIGNLYDQSKVDTYIKRTGYKFNEIPTVELAKMIKASGIFLYLEPATFISSLTNPAVPCYIDEDLKDIKTDEYVNAITFNGYVYKIIYNLINLKNTIIGRFQGAYNMDNIMIFDQLVLDNFFQQLKLSNKDDYFIHDNEQVSILVNRVFDNIWQIQYEILNKIKAKYSAAKSFDNNSFRII